MESSDVRDLPEEQVQVVAAFVEFLRRRLREAEAPEESHGHEREWSAGAATIFAKDWENDQDAIYDTWRERYHVPQG